MDNEKTIARINAFEALMDNKISKDFKWWLSDNGFFDAPASTKYHGAHEGGLFDHSYAVTKALLDLTENNRLKWDVERSPYIVGMFHDLCKIDLYVPAVVGGGWEHNNNLLLNGHGEKSIILLQPHIDLTEEEMLCIRWHMGAYDDKENWNMLGKAIEKYPNVLWTHTADMIAARVVGV